MILKSLKSFAKLEVAIFLLLLIAGFSILGTIIEQERSINYYLENYTQEINFLNITIGNLLLFCGLNNIYKSWWFLTLLLLFGTCLISCTILQQLPMLRQARRCSFKVKEKQYKNPQYSLEPHCVVHCISLEGPPLLLKFGRLVLFSLLGCRQGGCSSI